MRDHIGVIARSLMHLSAHMRSLGATPKLGGCLGTIRLRRTAFFAMAEQLRAISDRAFGAGESMRCMVHNGYWFELEPEKADEAGQ